MERKQCSHTVTLLCIVSLTAGDRDLTEEEEKRMYWSPLPWVYVDEYPHFVPSPPDTPIEWENIWDWESIKHRYRYPMKYGPRPEGYISSSGSPPPYEP